FEPVSSSTANASATFAKAPPTNEIVRAPNISRNSRSRRGARLRSALLPVAPKAGVGLPERHRLLVGVAVSGQVCLRAGRELLFGRAVAPARGPLAEAAAQLREVAADVVEHAEVDQCEPLRGAPLELVERQLPGLEVDLRRRRRREHELAPADSHARRAAR